MSLDYYTLPFGFCVCYILRSFLVVFRVFPRDTLFSPFSMDLLFRRCIYRTSRLFYSVFLGIFEKNIEEGGLRFGLM